MRNVRQRLGVLAVGVLLVASACTSESNDGDDAGTEGGGGSARPAAGITDDTIRISLIASDLSALSEQNLAPEIGDARATLEAVIADINADGGVLGREIELVPHVIEGAAAAIDPDAGRRACLEATEDDRPFAVIITAAITPETVECAARHEDSLTITMDSWPESFYEEAEGRLFSIASQISIGRERAYRAWPAILDEMDELDGRTVGIVRIDRAEAEAAVDGALVPALEDLGYEDPTVAVLPCPEGSEPQGCEQHDAAIQRLVDAEVDLVFLTAQTLAGSATVEAAANLGFTPQWTTIGNNVTNTVAQFFTNAKENYDGAIGIDTNFPQLSDDAQRCNEIAVAGGAEEFERGSDGYDYTAVTCLQLLTLVDAIEAGANDDGTITQSGVIAAFEAIETVPMLEDVEGSLGPDKHDAGDYVFVSRYDAATEEFAPIDDATPIAVE